MRPLEILGTATALAFGLAVLGFLAVLVRAFEFLGVFIAGVVVLLASYSFDLEDDSGQSPSAMQPQAQPNSPEEWAAQQSERTVRPSRMKHAKLFGLALVTIGALGFYLVQL